jgi:MFS family permease
MPDQAILPQSEPAQELEPPAVSSSSSSSLSEQRKNDGAPFKPSARFLLAFASLAVLTLMVALDGTSISVALPVIARRLHGSAIEAFWAGTSFLLAATVFQPNFASFSHIFGRMPVIIAAITLFLVGVFVAAFANNFAMMLAGRTVQGIGGGGVIAMTEVC